MINDANPPIDNKEYNKKAEKVQDYAITITYKQLMRTSPLGQFKETAPYLTKTLIETTTFSIYPEWRVNNGSIHYHGIIRIKDRIKWLKRTLPKLRGLGFFLIKPIDNMPKWQEYLVKELEVAEKIVGLKFPMEKEVVVETKTKPVYDALAAEIIDKEFEEIDLKE